MLYFLLTRDFMMRSFSSGFLFFVQGIVAGCAYLANFPSKKSK